MTKEDYIKISQGIHGWMGNNELSALYDMAKDSIGPIIEVGSYLGRSTVCIAGGNDAGGQHTFWTIDPCLSQFGGYEKPVDVHGQLVDNLKNAGVFRKVTVFKGTSVSAAQQFREPVGFLFIDAIHDFKHVQEDVHSWRDKVMVNGLLAAHDYGQGFAGVKEFFDKDRVMNDNYTLLRVVDTLAVFRKEK